MKTVADVLGEDWDGPVSILDAVQKSLSVVNDEKYEKILCSVSLGSDSDCLLDLTWRTSTRGNVDYVFMNPGLEMDATLKHKTYLENRYGIEIKEFKAKIPVPLAVKKSGIPFLSKTTSEFLKRLQRHNFDFANDGWKSYEELMAKYPNCKSALDWWCEQNGPAFNVNYHSFLKNFLIENPPTFPISPDCCTYSKKQTAHRLIDEGGYGLNITGVRSAENGQRKFRYKSCFDVKENGPDQYRALWWISDEDKKYYEDFFGIKHSDAYYEPYSLGRTGCSACSFARFYEHELEVLKENEPLKYKAALNIFSPAYEYTRAYHKYRDRMKQAKAEGGIDHE